SERNTPRPPGRKPGRPRTPEDHRPRFRDHRSTDHHRPTAGLVGCFRGPNHCLGRANTRGRAREAGIDMYLVKPVGRATLAGVLERFWRVIAPGAVAHPG